MGATKGLSPHPCLLLYLCLGAPASFPVLGLSSPLSCPALRSWVYLHPGPGVKLAWAPRSPHYIIL